MIAREMGVRLVAGPGDQNPTYLYEHGHILVRQGDVGDVVRQVNAGRRFPVPDPDEGDVKVGLVRMRVDDPEDPVVNESRDGGVAMALDAMKTIERTNGGRVVGSRNHIVAIASGGVNSCPSDEPGPPKHEMNPGLSFRPTVEQPSVTVLVVDTGLVENHRELYPWMLHVLATEGDTLNNTGHDRASDPVKDTDDVIKLYVGHGTFIAGIIAATAPAASVRVSAKLINAGAIDERNFGFEMLEALNPQGVLSDVPPIWPDIISLSAGTHNDDGAPLLGMEEFMSQLALHPETVLVAAAGNNGRDDPFWPAAYARLPEHSDAVVSVGALRRDGTEGACFTNHGNWVQVYAPGEKLTGAFLGTPTHPRKYRYQHSTYDHCRWQQTFQHDFAYDCTCGYPRRVGELSTSLSQAETETFAGRAEWSGTSFSTPVVAAMIANHMGANPGLGSRAAAAALLSSPSNPRARVHGLDVLALRPPLWSDGDVQRHPPSPAQS
ncbi:S8/S53 family peptidase [Sphaerisporangium flaviroseum]|uniref:S8/S53 family peptidase n=1 Tax=Sphaerisporangium flaviroseum TaxID=509199 RepID=A0ABP7J2C5_9ACTN